MLIDCVSSLCANGGRNGGGTTGLHFITTMPSSSCEDGGFLLCAGLAVCCYVARPSLERQKVRCIMAIDDGCGDAGIVLRSTLEDI
jgi:hypothetical protein